GTARVPDLYGAGGLPRLAAQTPARLRLMADAGSGTGLPGGILAGAKAGGPADRRGRVGGPGRHLSGALAAGEAEHAVPGGRAVVPAHRHSPPELVRPAHAGSL